ncbi:MAG: class I SAM-dependent methyltransferase, partial [Acidobacteriota bacterium]
RSLDMILDTGIPKDAAIIDVGGGSSTLVDDILDGGFWDVSVLDISSKAIEKSQERLGVRAEKVTWLVGDVTEIDLSADRFDLWHDRAVFHFLTEEDDRRKYVDLVTHSLKANGHFIVASFGPNGPQKCSGLDVVRYSPESMQEEFGNSFKVIRSVEESHQTPFSTTQEFVYCAFQKVGS